MTQIAPTRLFRGVSASLYAKLDGRLQPKTTDAFEHGFAWGEPGMKWGGGSTWGVSETNAVIRHQLDQAAYPTSGVSSTPHFERARFYALHGGEQNEGYVFTLDVAALLAHDVKVLRVCEHVKEPSVPEDDEYILVPPAGLAVPQAAVVDLVRVATA